MSSASGDEREALWEITPQIQGLLIGDKGYLSQPLQIALAQVDLDLQTPLRRNMSETRPLQVVRLSGVNYKDRFIESNFFSFSPQNRT